MLSATAWPLVMLLIHYWPTSAVPSTGLTPPPPPPPSSSPDTQPPPAATGHGSPSFENYTGTAESVASSPELSQSANATGLLIAVSFCVIFAALVIGWLACTVARRQGWLFFVSTDSRKSWSSSSTSMSAVPDDESERIVSKVNRRPSTVVNGGSRGWLADLFQLRREKRKPSIPFHVPTAINAVTQLDGCSAGGHRFSSPQPNSRASVDSGNVNFGLVSDRFDTDPIMASSDSLALPVYERRRSSVDQQSLSLGSAKSAVKGNEISSLCGIDPTLYKKPIDGDDDDDGEAIGHPFPEGHLGRIRFEVRYHQDTERLTLRLINARNLPCRHAGSANACDPFVRICLLPDTRGHVQSKFRKRTCNPKFDENFIFQVSLKNIDERTVKLTVYDVDRLRRHNVIGHSLLPLKGRQLDITSDRGLVVSLDLQSDTAIESMSSLVDQKPAELCLTLTYYDNAQRMNVGIVEGRNMKGIATSRADSDGGVSDFYVKVTMMRQSTVVKTKRTEVVKRDSDPKFNESFSFKMAPEAVDISSVVVVVWQSLSGQKDQCIGRVVLGSYMFTRGKELEHWTSAVSAPRQQVRQWHVLV